MEQWDIVIEQVPIVRGTMAHWGIVMGQLTMVKQETRQWNRVYYRNGTWSIL